MQRSGEASEERALSAGTLEHLDVPKDVAGVILDRLERLAPLARDAVTAASVVGPSFDVGIVSALAEAPVGATIDALEEAAAAGLIAEVGDIDFAFSHALVREAVYEGMTASRRVRLHHRAGEALEATATYGVHPAQLAHHFHIARRLAGPEKAIRYSVAAAEAAAASLAYEEAAEHYGRALAAWAPGGEHDAERAEVLLALGRVQLQAGDPDATRTFLEAAGDARRRDAPEQLTRAALGVGERYWEANVADAEYGRLLERALAGMGTADSPLRARLLARLAEHLHFGAGQSRGDALSGEAVALARRLDDRGTLVAALMGRHVALLDIEHLDERLQLIDEVLRLSGGHRALTAEGHHWRLFDLFELGDLTAAAREQDQLDALAQELRRSLFQHVAVAWRGVWAQLRGDVAAAERLATEAHDFGRRAQVHDADSVFAGKLFLLRRQQGRLGELLSLVEQLARGPGALLPWRVASALAQVETGDAAVGVRRYERLMAAGPEALPRDFFRLTTLALLTDACTALGDAEGARRLGDLLAPYAARNVQVSFTTCWGSVERYLGMLAATRGALDAASSHLERALDRNRTIGAPILVAQTQCELGAALLRRCGPGDAERARALGRDALAVVAPLGLDALAARSRALAAA